jgi:hypothetical protein
MVAAEMLFLLDQHDLQFGPLPRDGKRYQATGKAAADNGQIAFDRSRGCQGHVNGLASR